MGMKVNRRWLLTRIVQGFGVVGAGFVTYPFLKAWLPKFDQDVSLEVNLDDLAPGAMKKVRWLGRNVYLLRREREDIAALETMSDLKDPESLESQQPGVVDPRLRSVRPDVFVAYTNCTHLGCEVVMENNQFICPCHQSEFDLAGRVKNGSAATRNLDVPGYKYLSANLLVLTDAIES